jgi:hypothetical protein
VKVVSDKLCNPIHKHCTGYNGMILTHHFMTFVIIYFVFKGKRMMDDLINGATPGAAGTVSETGWSNSICQTISSTSYQAEMMTQYFCFLMDISLIVIITRFKDFGWL